MSTEGPAGRDAALPALPGSLELAVRALRCWLVMYRRTWRSSAWSAFLGPLFYLGAMGYGIGSLVDRNGTASLGGVPYVVYVAPAVLAVQAMNAGLTNATFPVFGGIHWNKIYIAASMTMLRPADIYRGHLLSIAAWSVVNSASFVLLMAALGLIRSAWAIGLLPVAMLIAITFAAPVAAWAVTLQTHIPLNYLFRFGSVPLMLFSGTFFPISQLPGWLRPLAYATPLWHGVALCRALSLGTVSAGSAAIHVGYLLGVTGIGLWAGARSYTRRLYV